MPKDRSHLFCANPENKICCRCLVEQPKENFFNKKESKDGLNWSCKSCGKISAKKYKEENPEKFAESKKRWRDNNIEKSRAASAAWAAANPERMKGLIKAWQQANKDRVKANQIAWAAANREKRNAVERNRRARKNSSDGDHTQDDVFRIFELQRGKCAHCTVKLKKSGNGRYHVDHVMPIFIGGGNGPENLQMLCPKCNREKWAKHPLEWAKLNGKLL